MQRLSANVEGKCQKYSRIGALTLVPLEEEVTLPNIKVACKSHFKANLECDILAGERGPSYADASQIQNWKVVHIRFIEKSRLQNSRIFCERERRCRSIFERKVWSECKNGEGEWGETLKNTTVRHPYIKLVQNYPFFQQWEIPIGLILTQSVIKCQSHLIKKIRKPTIAVDRAMAFEILKSQGFDTLLQAPLALANQIGHRLVTSFASTVFDRFFRSSGEILFNKFGDLQYNSNSRLIAL